MQILFWSAHNGSAGEKYTWGNKKIKSQVLIHCVEANLFRLEPTTKLAVGLLLFFNGNLAQGSLTVLFGKPSD